MEKLFLTDPQFTETIDHICGAIKESGFIPDIVLSVGRGGMVPARYIADTLPDSEVSLISAKMYTGVGTRESKPKIGHLQIPVFGKKVLIVDDIIDSGLTIDGVIEALQKGKAAQIKTATLAIKRYSKRLPSFYHLIIDDEVWIVFPWEKNEFGD